MGHLAGNNSWRFACLHFQRPPTSVSIFCFMSEPVWLLCEGDTGLYGNIQNSFSIFFWTNFIHEIALFLTKKFFWFLTILSQMFDAIDDSTR